MMIKSLFAMTLILGTTITLSSANWISAWVGLELNLMSFIPLMMLKTSTRTSESSLKYFLIQTIASMTLLVSAIILLWLSIKDIIIMSNIKMMSSYTLTIALMLKMGAAPLHFWFPSMIQGMSWMNCLILMTWQKLAPLYLMLSNNNNMVPLFAMISSITGAIGGLSMLYMRKIMAYSSINHLGWMITATMISDKMLMLYFITYSFLSALVISMLNSMNIFHLTQIMGHDSSKYMPMMLTTNLMSLGGIPPFIGFLPKGMIITSMMNIIPFQVFVITMSSLFTLYFYMRVGYTMIMKSPTYMPLNQTKISKTLMMMTSLSMVLLMLITPMI